jgi:hypothetical protein
MEMGLWALTLGPQGLHNSIMSRLQCPKTMPLLSAILLCVTAGLAMPGAAKERSFFSLPQTKPLEETVTDYDESPFGRFRIVYRLEAPDEKYLFFLWFDEGISDYVVAFYAHMTIESASRMVGVSCQSKYSYSNGISFWPEAADPKSDDEAALIQALRKYPKFSRTYVDGDGRAEFFARALDIIKSSPISKTQLLTVPKESD